MPRCAVIAGFAFLLIFGAACDGNGGGGSGSASVPKWVGETREAVSGSGELSDKPETVEFEGETLYVFEGEPLGVVLAEDCALADEAAKAGKITVTACVQRGSNEFQLIG